MDSEIWRRAWDVSVVLVCVLCACVMRRCIGAWGDAMVVIEIRISLAHGASKGKSLWSQSREALLWEYSENMKIIGILYPDFKYNEATAPCPLLSRWPQP